MSVWNQELQQLKREWVALPAKCATEADQIAESAAKGARQAIATAYSQHWVTGKLTRSVYVTRFAKGKLTPGWLVKAASPTAHLLEHGTRKRFYVTKQNHKIHATGAGPAEPGLRIVAQIVPGFRLQQVRQTKDMLRRQKLEVTGDA